MTQPTTDPRARWEELCNAQGWNDESQIAILEGFVSSAVLWAEFVNYAEQTAREENESC